MNFTELKNFIEDMTADVSNLKTAIEGELSRGGDRGKTQQII